MMHHNTILYNMNCTQKQRYTYYDDYPVSYTDVRYFLYDMTT